MKILALGIGNVMFSDEGIGVHLCELLKQKYTYKSKEHSIDFVDGGTLAQRLIPVIAQYEYVVIFDCVDANGGEVGDVYFFDFENVPNSVTWQGSAHEVEMLQTLSMMDMLGDRPITKIIGIIPQSIDITTLSLSQKVQKGALKMEEVFIQHLKTLGISCEKLNDMQVQQIANKACQGSYE